MTTFFYFSTYSLTLILGWCLASIILSRKPNYWYQQYTIERQRRIYYHMIVDETANIIDLSRPVDAEMIKIGSYVEPSSEVVRYLYDALLKGSDKEPQE